MADELELVEQADRLLQNIDKTPEEWDLLDNTITQLRPLLTMGEGNWYIVEAYEQENMYPRG